MIPFRAIGDLQFNPTDPAFVADPYPTYHRLRAQDPVHHSRLGFWVLTRYEDVVASLRDRRLAEEPDAPWVLSSSPRHAHVAGFDLHANVAVPAAARACLEQLCRYLRLRPPVAQDRLLKGVQGDGAELLTKGRRAQLNSPSRLSPL